MTADRCEEIQPLLRELVRGQLDEPTRARVDSHLGGCAACRAVAEEERSLDGALERLPQHAAPLALKRRLQARLPAPAPSRPRRWSWALPLSLAAVAAALFLVLRSRAPSEPLVAEAVADHLRVVYREHPVDIESGGPHQVKPWFSGRLDFALPAVFGGDADFELEGGSVGYFVDRPAAVLLYRRQLHRISLLVFRGEGLSFPATNQRLSGGEASVRVVRGFSLVMWRAGDLGYALVSDLNSGDLLRLAGSIAGSR